MRNLLAAMFLSVSPSAAAPTPTLKADLIEAREDAQTWEARLKFSPFELRSPEFSPPGAIAVLRVRLEDVRRSTMQPQHATLKSS